MTGFFKRMVCFFIGHRLSQPFPFCCMRCHKYWFQASPKEWAKKKEGER